MHTLRQPIRKAATCTAALVLLAGLGTLLAYGPSTAALLDIATAYKAKEVATFALIAQRPNDDAVREVEEDDPSLRFIQVTINRDEQFVRASCFGLFSHTAHYHPSLGCLLLHPGEQNPLLDIPVRQTPPMTVDPIETPMPPSTPRHDRLAEVVRFSFSEESPSEEKRSPRFKRRTRALLIQRGDRLVIERYAKGFSPDTRFCGWSMTKSVMGILAMMRVEEGALTLGSKPNIPAWKQNPTDPRQDITLANLMTMTSGLQFTENYLPTDDVVKMLYGHADMARYASEKPLVSPQAVGQRWQYSSGSANLVSRLFRDSFSRAKDHLNYPYERLFHPLGMNSALLEVDGSATFVGSSSLHATARDWLQLARLILNEGQWNGQQIISKASMEYLFTRTHKAPSDSIPPSSGQTRYGALWWINLPHPGQLHERWMPEVPADAVIAQGHFGQVMAIIPSMKLVVLRFGLSKGDAFHLEEFLPNILNALPESG